MVAALNGFGDSRVSADIEVDPESNTVSRDVLSTGIPYYERFFLGGENQIRGYDIRSIGPRDARGFLVGGTKMLLFNAEYYIPLAGPLRLVLFFDAGQAYTELDNWSLSMLRDLRTSTGAEVRFFVPVLNVPFRLIYAFNPHRDIWQPATAFKFGIGTTF
jgi:outer membrane protein assembly factor BamA